MTRLEPSYGKDGQPKPAAIDTSDAQFALDLVKAICKDVGPGLPGTSKERERAAAIKKELEVHLDAGNVATEEFTVAPNAFLGSLILSGIFVIVAALLNVSTGSLSGISSLVTSMPSLVFSIMPLLLFVVEFVYSFEIIDSLFGKRQSVNVIGTLRKPGTTSVKRLLILSGHHDSAWENTWLRLPGYGFFVATFTWIAGMITMLVMAVIQLTGVITVDTGIIRIGTLNWILLAYPILPSVILSLAYNIRRGNGGSVPGAADNLSACGVVVAMCRFLVRNPECIPADTEIRFVTFGSEEAGLRGSRRYVERHLEELKRLDARLLNLEIVAYREIGILSSEINGTVKNSPEMVRSVVAAADRAGVPYREKPASLGVAGDAGPFSRAGIKATTLLSFKMPQQMLAFYHQKWDRPEVLSIEPILNTLKTCFEWINSGGRTDLDEP